MSHTLSFVVSSRVPGFIRQFMIVCSFSIQRVNPWRRCGFRLRLIADVGFLQIFALRA